MLYGEGNFVLTDVKEIDGTDNFLELDEDDKQCQGRETFQECQAREYIKTGLEKCKCTPYKMRNYSKTVSLMFHLLFQLSI